MTRTATQRLVEELVRHCHAGLDAETLRGDVLRRLRAILSIDAAFVATVDPATILFTSVFAEPPLDTAAPQFLANEFGAPDVNKFVDLANAAVTARSLDEATGHARTSSARAREIMTPLGLGDELRVTLRSGSAVWGVLCLHRADAAAGFSDDEIRTVESIAPHVGAGIRRSVMTAYAERTAGTDEVGLIMLDPSASSVVSANAAGARLLDELAASRPTTAEIPSVVVAVARRAATDRPTADTMSPTTSSPAAPSVRFRTSSGRWLVIHASVLSGPQGSEHIAVVAEPAEPRRLTSLVLRAYDLTPREETVAELVLRGSSTQEIVNTLAISSHTVQDHLKSIFAKFGVGSRRELVAALLGGTHD